MTESALVPATPSGMAIAEQAAVAGDLSKLTADQRMRYYSAVCESVGLNPLTRPFEYITLNGKLTLYARRDATDQLRVSRKVTITDLVKEQVGELLVVTASGRTPDGRQDMATGAVSIAGLRGENLANAMMKAETKAKRRLTLSLVGLGFPTEDEVADVPQDAPPPADAPKSLAEKAAERAASVTAVPEPATATESAPETEAESVAMFTEIPEAPAPTMDWPTFVRLAAAAQVTANDIRDGLRAIQVDPGKNPMATAETLAPEMLHRLAVALDIIPAVA